MKVSRRGFLKASGATASVALLSRFGMDKLYAGPDAKEFKIKYAKESTTICPYCAVGCGQIVSVKDGKVINIEGDPDHPINRGSLCSKGSALYQLANNERRITKIKYRAPYATEWEEKSWDWAIDEMAIRLKNTRDTGFIEKNSQGDLVNRTEAIANLGGSALDNEECYLLAKLTRAMGLVYIEHHARI